MPATKRAATATASPRGKKAKASAEDVACRSVATALRAAELEPELLETVLAAMPYSLALAKEERHVLQEKMVEHIGSLLEARSAQLTALVGAAEVEGSAASERRAVREGEAKAAQEDVDARHKECHDAKVVLANIAKKFQAAKTAKQEAELAAEKFAKELKGSTKKKDEAEGLLKTMDSLHEKSEGIPGFVRSLQQHVQVDDSLRTAIPCAFSKDPESRGLFDKMVVDQLADRLKQHITDLQATLDSGETQTAALQQGIDKAAATLSEAKDAQLGAYRAYNAVAETSATSETAFATAKKELALTAKAHKDATNKVTEAQVDLELFKDGPLVAFSSLRDRELPAAPAVEAPEEEAPALVAVAA